MDSFLFVLNTEFLLKKILWVENKQLTVHILPFIFVQNSHCFLCRKNQYNMVQCLQTIKQKSIPLIYFFFNLGCSISYVFETLQVASFIHAVHINISIWSLQCCLSMLNSLKTNFYLEKKASCDTLWQDIEYSSYGSVFVFINRNDINI